jgi:adenine-specific DNA-methyltransferase
MLARYLGSKQAILDELLTTVGRHCTPGSHVVDAFSGSLAVSLGLKKSGYRVTANDINLFSHVLAEAYLVPSQLPQCDAKSLVPAARRDEATATAQSSIEKLDGSPGFGFLKEPEHRRRYQDFLMLLHHLSTLQPQDLPVGDRRNHFLDTYCEEGGNSAYVSSRGAEGRRRFFTEENARRIDLVMNQIRSWHRSERVDAPTYALLLATFLRAVEKVSNTQGTYHDFPRSTWDSRALRPLTFDPPALDVITEGSPGPHLAGREQDSLDFVAKAGRHDLLYLDPPYNFRQYSAYYFLPNVLCRYPEMADPDDYFSKVRFVRGQNPEDDFTSTFCKPKHFIEDMGTLIERADCDTVVISYFTGRNHWSKFDTERSDTGLEMLSGLLEGDLFEPGSLTVTEIPRRNYASYGGYQARTVAELILVATKRRDQSRGTAPSPSGRLQPVA